MTDVNERIAEAMRSEGLLNEENSKIAVRAGFKCKYCGLKFLKSAENYRSGSGSHRPEVRRGDDSFENMAAGGCPAFLLNIEKRSLPRLMLSGGGLASKNGV
jgi:hypothetical protein